MSNFYYPSSPSSSSSPPFPIASSSSSSSSSDDGNHHDDGEDGSEGERSSLKRRRTSASEQHDQLAAPEEQPVNAATCMWTDSEGKECGRTFSSLSPFITHVHDDHIGNTRQAYVCEWSTCPRKGKVQTSRFALVSHFRSHSGEKPFLCPEAQCDKSFTRSDALAKHMRIQHSINPLLSARNVAQNNGGPTAKHPEREPAPDAVGGRGVGKGREREKEAKMEEEEWARMEGEVGGGSKRRKSSSSGGGGGGGGGKKGGEGAGGEGGAGGSVMSTSTSTAAAAAEQDPSYDSDSDDSFTGHHMPPPPSSSSHSHSHAKHSQSSPSDPSNTRPRHVVRYLIGKAIHREAMRERDELEAELEGVKRELKASWEWKEKALDAVLRRDLGEEEAKFLIKPITSIPPPPAPPAISVLATTTNGGAQVVKREEEGGDVSMSSVAV